MVIKLLHIVAAIVLAAAGIFAIKNRSAFKEARTEKNRINREEVKPTLTKIDDGIIAIEDEIKIWDDAWKSREGKKVELIGAQSKFKATTDELANITKEIADKTAELNKFETEIQEILGPGVTIDQLNQTVEALNQEITNLKAEAETLAKQLDVQSQEVKKKEGDVAVLQRTAAARNKGISLNSLEATVVAVNPDYGFAVIDAGENRGITADSKLIVKRGNQRVGLLNITSIERTKTIGDIIPDSANSVSIAPGDRVIIEKVQR